MSASHPGSAYRTELDRLAETLRHALELPPDLVASVFAHLADRQALMVGSGGMLAVAQLASEVHAERTGRLAVATTPLGLLGSRFPRRTGVVVFSARAKHPDVRFALQQSLDNNLDPVRLVTHRSKDEATATAPAGVDIVSVPTLVDRDGFLATNSVLAMATLVARVLTGIGKPLPSSLPSLELPVTPGIGSRCLVLHGPGQATAAIDLEARLAETGLASVQTTDYRNLAHGRHYGLSKTASEQVVIALIAPPYVELAEATLRLLPCSVNVVRLSSDLPWPASALDLLVASMNLVAATASSVGFDPARPRVPEFGRRLYRLSALGHMRRVSLTPVNRKLQELGIPAGRSLRDLYRDELARWTGDVAKVPIGALVVDYDGTVCTTAERFDLPAMRVRDEFIRLLEAGVMIAFASGRGRSLHRDLRSWIPKDWWQTIRLGLYNGALEIRLSDPEPVRGQASGELLELVERLRASPLADAVTLEVGAWQLGILAAPGIGFGSSAIATWVSEAIGRAPRLPVKVVSSGHSIDVIHMATTKASLLKAVNTEKAVMAIGDQGHVGGNDFELLAATRWSLSVDRCSSDPTRCWNLVQSGQKGPAALIPYLRALQGRPGGEVRLSSASFLSSMERA